MKVELKERAVEDVRAANDWYNARRVGLGDEFLEELDEVFEAISEQPRMCQVVEGEVRRALLHRFPFSIYYLPESDVLVVLAVLHTRRHPNSWKRAT